MANNESRHHRSNVVNYIEDGTHIDADRDVADTAMKYWDLSSPIDVKVTNEFSVDLDDAEDSVKVGDGTETLNITASNEALTAINTDNVGLFKDSSFTETRQLTDVNTGGSQTNDLLVALNQALPAGSNNIGEVNNAEIPTLTTDANDNLQVDIPGQPLDASAAEIDVDINSQTLGDVSVTNSDLPTLTTDANNFLQVSLDAVPAEPLDVSGATVTVTDDGAFDINSLPSLPTGSNNIGEVNNAEIPTLTTDANDNLQVDIPSQPLDVSGATVTVTDDGSFAINTLPSIPAGTNNIGSVDLDDVATGGTQSDNLLVDIAAQSLSTVATDQQNNAEAYHNSTTISASGTLSATLDAVGAERLEGQVQSSGSYDVRLDWKDDQGNVIRQETIASGVSGGTWTDISQASKSPHVDVVVVENSGSDQTVDATLHLR